MRNSHKLLNKSDKFSLSEHSVRKQKYYQIDLNLRHRFWTAADKMTEYDSILNSQNRINKFGWKYDNEEEAKAKYTWAVLKWDKEETSTNYKNV